MKTYNYARITIGLLAVSGLAVSAWAQDVFAPCWRGQPNSTFQIWDFETSSPSAAPSFSSNPYGTGQAQVTLGNAASGHLASLADFGLTSTNLGFWDLGGSGTIQLTIPNVPSAPAGSYKLIRVQVPTYIGGLLNYATVTVPGATYVTGAQKKTESIGARGDAIWVDETVWRVQPSPASDAITITAPPDGALVDDVIVDTWCITDPNIYVDAGYGAGSCIAVGWPNGAIPSDKFLGETAFSTIQNGISAAPTGGAVLVAGGSYSGNVTVDKNLTFKLGPAAAQINLAGNMDFTSGSKLEVNLDGATAGSGYDRIAVTGTVNLGGATLVASSAFPYTIGTTLVLIDNDGTDAVTGTFAGLAEGATVNLGTAVFTISYAGGTGNDVVLVASNNAPIAVLDSAGAIGGLPTVIPFYKLLRNDSDPDNDTFTITAVNAPYPANGTVVLGTDTVTYTPPIDFSGMNWFTYTITDSRGASSVGRVDVKVTANEEKSLNIVSISTPDSGATFIITIAGVPTHTYRIERGSTAIGPWVDIGGATCLADGMAVFTDGSPGAGAGFYRARTP